MLTIVEALADFGHSIKDPDQLTEFVRQRLARTIVRPYIGQQSGALSIINLGPDIEQEFQSSLRQTEQGTFLAMDPGMAQKIIQAINQAAENAMIADGQPILLTSPQTRPHLAQLVTRFIPTLPVISQAEIPAEIRLNSLATVSLKNAR